MKLTFILYVHLKYFGFVIVKADNGFKFPGGVRRIYMRRCSLIAQEFKKVERLRSFNVTR